MNNQYLWLIFIAGVSSFAPAYCSFLNCFGKCLSREKNIVQPISISSNKYEDEWEQKRIALEAKKDELEKKIAGFRLQDAQIQVIYRKIGIEHGLIPVASFGGQTKSINERRREFVSADGEKIKEKHAQLMYDYNIAQAELNKINEELETLEKERYE